jgi:hypothetical protein
MPESATAAGSTMSIGDAGTSGAAWALAPMPIDQAAMTTSSLLFVREGTDLSPWKVVNVVSSVRPLEPEAREPIRSRPFDRDRPKGGRNV